MSYLQPIPTALTGLVATLIRIQHLYHETLTRRLDTVLQQILDLIKDIGISELGELEFAFHGLEAFVQ